MLISTVNGHVITSHHLPIIKGGGGVGEELKAISRDEEDRRHTTLNEKTQVLLDAHP